MESIILERLRTAFTERELAYLNTRSTFQYAIKACAPAEFVQLCELAETLLAQQSREIEMGGAFKSWFAVPRKTGATRRNNKPIRVHAPRLENAA